MTARIVSPNGRGILLLDAHPIGCMRSVEQMSGQLRARAGYGLAATIAGLAGHGNNDVGIGFERAPGRHTGAAGWYRTAATAALARELDSELHFVNADAFADSTKAEVLDPLAKRFGGPTAHG
jgi:enoyl-[acyl-carrier protein] reductase/trans-2-enoyl-CoA reductase (NAD+)